MASAANVLRWVDPHGRECVRVCVCERVGGGGERWGSVCKISTSGIALIQLTAELERDVELFLSRVEFTRQAPF